ncbi:MAG: 4-hydroxybenzoate polyprenyltransferase [Bacteroidia bacterium]|jgi:4-hydroxybenzoate polyprenyltransferase
MKEIFLMTGFSFIGMLFVPAESWKSLDRLLLSTTAIIFYVMAVFFLNSYAGYEGDAQSERLKYVSKVSKTSYLLLTVTSIIIFSLCAYSISWELLMVTGSSVMLWFAYYLKPIQLKSILFGGTIAHFIGGALHFHMGYTAFQPANLESVQVSIFFSLILCTGHFNHEMMDAEDDRKSGQHTTTVRLGPDTALVCRHVAAMLSSVYAILLLYKQIFETTSGLVLAIASVVMLTSSVFTKHNTIAFQKISRAVFFLAGLFLIFKKLA